MFIRNRKLTALAFLTPLAIIAGACGEAQTPEQWGSNRSDLYLSTSVPFTENHNLVPVCWLAPGFTTEKSWVAAAANATWSTESSVKFTFQQGCPTSGSQKFVRADTALIGNIGESGGSTFGSCMGMAGLVLPGVNCASPYQHALGISFGGMPTTPAAIASYRARIEYVGVHELGHLLGYWHEQDRTDSTCYDSIDPNNGGGTIQGAFDHDSIMDYCQAGGNNNDAITQRDKIGIRQVYARPDLSVMGVANGQLYHGTRKYDGTSRDPFRDVEKSTFGEIASFTNADMRYDRKGEVQVAAVAGGKVYHAIRYPNYTWSKLIDVKPYAGDLGAVTKVSLADSDDAMHLATASGTDVWHVIRQGSGSWTGLERATANLGSIGTVSDISITTARNMSSAANSDDLQFCAVSSTGRAWHGMRRASGQWEIFRDLETNLGEIGIISSISCTWISEQLHVVLVSTSGGVSRVYHRIRYDDGSWSGAWGDVIQATNSTLTGSPVEVDTSQFKGQLHVGIRANGKLWHTLRDPNAGAWTALRNISSEASAPASFTAIALE